MDVMKTCATAVSKPVASERNGKTDACGHFSRIKGAWGRATCVVYNRVKAKLLLDSRFAISSCHFVAMGICGGCAVCVSLLVEVKPSTAGHSAGEYGIENLLALATFQPRSVDEQLSAILPNRTSVGQ